MAVCFGRLFWPSVLEGSVEDCWSKFKGILLSLQNKFVPVSVVKDKSKVPMNYKALKWIKKKHKVFRKYKSSSHPACRRVAKIASRETKRAKYNFERKLADNIKKDTKSFYAYVNRKAKGRRNIGPLLNDLNEVVDSAEGIVRSLIDLLAQFLIGKGVATFRRLRGYLRRTQMDCVILRLLKS